MSEEKNNLKNELRSYRIEYDVLKKTPCTKEECKEYQKILDNDGTLPDGVYKDTDTNYETLSFYTVDESNLTEAETMEYLTYKQLHMLKTIKNCVLFFTTLTIISMIVFLLIMLRVI